MVDRNNKQLLRNKLLAERKLFNKALYQQANEAIYQTVVELIKSSKPQNIGLYWSLQGEPDLLQITSSVEGQFSLPVIEGDEIAFAKYKAGDSLEKTPFFGLYQPAKKLKILPDLIIIPGLAFSIKGYRLGFGKGYYDRFLAKIEQISKPLIVGVCFDDKLFKQLPFDQNDYKVNYIVTDKRMIKI